MKKALYTIFTILIAIVLTGKGLNLLLIFTDGINQVLNAVMYTLIGIAYIIMGYVWDNKFLKIVIMACGLFLIAMNFFRNNDVLSITGIVCILIPMLIARLYKKENNEVSATQS